MRFDQWNLNELFEFEPAAGVIRFAGRRALLWDAVGFGFLRKELIRVMGAVRARGVLMRVGYACGRQTAEELALSRGGVVEWHHGVARLLWLRGVVTSEPVVRSRGDGGHGAGRPFLEAVWKGSWEAEQHLAHMGRWDEPVCWTLTGFFSGYFSHYYGREIYCMETGCRGSGDSTCYMVARFRDEWGPEQAIWLAGLEEDDSDMAALSGALEGAAARLGEYRRALSEVAGVDVERGGMVACSRPMRQVVDLAYRAAAVDASVLISGESGVGKERVARLIHERSARAARPLVVVRCSPGDSEFWESELFGHERGAFTGAGLERPGLFEEARGSTLFLAEIAELSPVMQAKLARVLADGQVQRIGGSQPRPTDVRIVAATQSDLAAEVASGRFRKDLYYRLRVFELVIPSLRLRSEDILPLAQFFARCGAVRMGKEVAGFTDKAAEFLVAYEWPGNVRELENAIAYALLIADTPLIGANHLPAAVRSDLPPRSNLMRIRPLHEVEREHILSVLAANRGHRSRTAEALRIGRATLHRKLKQYQREGRLGPDE